jgi:hypothetical protein
LLNANKVLERSEKKKEVENDLLFALAPLTAQFSNQLFEDFKKLYELKPFINVEALHANPGRNAMY